MRAKWSGVGQADDLLHVVTCADVGEPALGKLGVMGQRRDRGQREARILKTQAPLEHEPRDPTRRGTLKRRVLVGAHQHDDRQRIGKASVGISRASASAVVRSPRFSDATIQVWGRP